MIFFFENVGVFLLKFEHVVSEFIKMYIPKIISLNGLTKIPRIDGILFEFYKS